MDDFLKWLDKIHPGERAFLTPYQLELARAYFERGVVMELPRPGKRNHIGELVKEYETRRR